MEENKIDIGMSHEETGFNWTVCLCTGVHAPHPRAGVCHGH